MASNGKPSPKEITVVVADGVADSDRTRGLKPGDPNFGRVRRPPLAERLGSAAGEVYGQSTGELVYATLEAIRRKSIPAAAGRLLLERLIPPGRPIRLGLPCIRTADDLIKAQDIITDAMNDGTVTPAEAAAVQTVVAEAWRAQLEAHEHPNVGVKEAIDPEAYRERICKAARRYGMVWPSGHENGMSPNKNGT